MEKSEGASRKEGLGKEKYSIKEKDYKGEGNEKEQ